MRGPGLLEARPRTHDRAVRHACFVHLMQRTKAKHARKLARRASMTSRHRLRHPVATESDAQTPSCITALRTLLPLADVRIKLCGRPCRLADGTVARVTVTQTGRLSHVRHHGPPISRPITNEGLSARRRAGAPCCTLLAVGTLIKGGGVVCGVTSNDVGRSDGCGTGCGCHFFGRGTRRSRVRVMAPLEVSRSCKWCKRCFSCHHFFGRGTRRSRVRVMAPLEVSHRRRMCWWGWWW